MFRFVNRIALWISGHEPGDFTENEGSERRRAAALGGAFVATAGMAVVGGSTFAHDLLDLAWPAALVAGLAWGSLVVLFERAVVLSLRRRWHRALIAPVAARIILAGLIGYVIAQPLTFRVFHDELAAEIGSYNRTEFVKRKAEIAKDPDFGDAALAQLRGQITDAKAAVVRTGPDPALVEADADVARVLGELNAATADADKKAHLVECENDATCGSGEAGFGPIATLRREEWAQAMRLVAAKTKELELKRQAARDRLGGEVGGRADQARAELPGLEAQLADLAHRRQVEVDVAKKQEADNTGLTANMEAMHRLEHQSGLVEVEHWLLIGLMLGLDTLPVTLELTTLIGRRSARDERTEATEAHDHEQHRLDLIHDAELQELGRQADLATFEEYLEARRQRDRRLNEAHLDVEDELALRRIRRQSDDVGPAAEAS